MSKVLRASVTHTSTGLPARVLIFSFASSFDASKRAEWASKGASKGSTGRLTTLEVRSYAYAADSFLLLGCVGCKLVWFVW